MSYLTSDLLQARVGGITAYLELTDDDANGAPDTDVEDFLFAQVDAVANSYMMRAGYTVPVDAVAIVPLLPALLDIANYKAKTRSNRVASEDDRNLFAYAMKLLDQVATGDFVLIGLEPSPVIDFGFDSPQGDLDFDSDGRFFSRSRLRNF